jgi:apolipoprotein N-acyltransferase
MSRVWLVVMLVLVCFVSMIDAVLAGVAGTQTWFWASVRIAALVALVVSALRPAWRTKSLCRPRRSSRLTQGRTPSDLRRRRAAHRWR